MRPYIKNVVNEVKFTYVAEEYKSPEKKAMLVYDLTFSEVYMIYTNKVENAYIKENSDDYDKYLNLYKINLTNPNFQFGPHFHLTFQ